MKIRLIGDIVGMFSLSCDWNSRWIQRCNFDIIEKGEKS